MATVKYGSLVTELKGKLGGHIYQSSGSKKIVRTNKPATPLITTRLLDNRNYFYRLVNYWNSTLKPNYYNQIAAVANTYPAHDKYGNPTVPTPYQVHIMVNSLGIRTSYGMILPVHEFVPPYVPVFANTIWNVSINSCIITYTGDLSEGLSAFLFLGQPQRNLGGLTTARYKLAYIMTTTGLYTANINSYIRNTFWPSGGLQSGMYNNWIIPAYYRIYNQYIGSWGDSNYFKITISNP